LLPDGESPTRADLKELFMYIISVGGKGENRREGRKARQ
jgi:hypothetical protein